MSRIYDNSFRAGVSVSILVWLVVNMINFYFAQKQHEETGITFSHGSGSPFDWGVPFYWTTAGGFFTNAVLVALTSIVVGHIFRFVRTKYRSVENE